MTFVMKQILEDFKVKEVPAFQQVDRSDSGEHRYFRVRKKNHETFDVVTALSTHFNVAKEEIGFSGLKDKDGITDQYISIKSDNAKQLTTVGFNTKYYESEGDDRFMQLLKTGLSGNKLAVADLLGNTFDIVARSLDEKFCDKLDGLGAANFIFINYYDTQRFGVPGKKKVTHKIGEALEQKDYDKAIEFINEVGDSCDIETNPIVDKEDLYERIDLRKIAFYRSSFSSHLWNAQIQALLVDSLTADQLVFESRDNVPFVYAKKMRDVMPVISTGIPYKYKRHLVVDGQIVALETNRPEFIQLNVRCGQPEPDELHSGKYKCRFQFFLPSGCYATMALRQLMQNIKHS